MSSIHRSTLLFTVVVLLASAVQADEQARAVIDKAIAATGGEAVLAKFRAQTWNETGTYYGMGEGLPYTAKSAAQWPDKSRMEIVGVFTSVHNGDKCWIQTGGVTEELEGQRLRDQLDQHYCGWVTTLQPLKDPAFKLSQMGEYEVEGKPAVGIKVTREGKPNIELYFDKDSGRLVKCRNRARSEAGEDVDQEILFRDYQDVQGMKCPMAVEIRHDGKKFVEAKYHDVVNHEKLDDSLFAKP